MAAISAPEPSTKPLRFVTNYGAPYPKRRRIGAACLTCRKKKTACSGERPHCATCKQNRLECAGYSAEQASLDKNVRSVKPSTQSRHKVDDLVDPAFKTLSTDVPSMLQSPATTTSSTSAAKQESLFSGPRNRMPYFRWLGPTAIMSGYKQMVVKLERHDRERAASSIDGMPLPNSPPLLRTGSETRQSSFCDRAGGDGAVTLPSYDASQMPPSELITHLAQIFFFHLGCNYPFLQQDRFMRDLEEKQVDAILVHAVCALAARFSDHPLLQRQAVGENKSRPAEYGQAFAQRAKSALLDTFACPTVAAVQAALLLAYNEFGESRDSGLWMYLGIAIRLAQDLGMHKLEGLRYKGVSGITPKMVNQQSDRRHLTSFLPVKSIAPDILDDQQSTSQSAEEVEQQKAAEQERMDTFWAVFFLDRVVSSGTGRTSTLRDKDIELSFPPLEQETTTLAWPAPFPALIRIIHLYGRVADLLNSIKEYSDVTVETSKRLAAMETQVNDFYQGLSSKLHFGAESFQHYVQAGEGTNFVLLHFWFHTLIVLLHQPTLLKTFERRSLQLFPNSQKLSMSSAKTIADILSYSQLLDAKASLGNPFTTQPIYIAACAFLRETAENSASSNSPSRPPSPPESSGDKEALLENSARQAGPERRIATKHTLLAQAANQHYQLCYKALRSLETYWAGTKYILTVLNQKFEGVGDPLLYTVEEGESAMERPKKEPAFTRPGWRRSSSFSQQSTVVGINATTVNYDRRPSMPHVDRQSANAIGWTLTGTMDSPSTNLARHYARNDSGRRRSSNTSSTTRNAPDHERHDKAHPSTTGPSVTTSDVLDASLLLGLHSPHSAVPFKSITSKPTATLQQFTASVQNNASDTTNSFVSTMPDFDGMFIESQDVDMSTLDLDMMPWFDATYGIDNTALLGSYHMPLEQQAVSHPLSSSRRLQTNGDRLLYTGLHG